jgi:hypothetical protein
VAELDIAVFLRARLDERELMLRTDSPAQIAWATFRHADGSMRYTSVASSNGDVWVCDGHVVEPDSVQVVFDRAQELADVAAKRRLLAGHGPGRWVDESGGRWKDEPDNWDAPWQKCAGEEWTSYPCETVRLLALPYAGHPDYREEWKP